MFLLLYDICIGRHKDIPYPKLKQLVYALFTQKSEEFSYPTQTLYSEAINPNCFL